ncbi:Gfo/Idh/MocA family protein [Paenibacillus radicis (ex Xue et al. 2023)]|uniref:Gfo/Idh/MocA family oxidoreductase n=1 Tax=Paenibacillus radicis (ex Xue et al. 2023) TaxID=2972489 RepID=A0ABT1YII7_9BACL|nr:Gfo/Idh/MocA family oxidoreductase [Paenibacillus radicis (ex Xue et al. 2023)]MCR8632991.1 Gfo/Idh/MocA family oxidoreductase [Paenibacillus radicis (ex Xue et al. 2023)]
MLKVAVVGLSGSGERYAQHLLSMEQTEIVGVYDMQPEVASEWAQRFGCPAFGSYDALIAALPSDAVCIGLGLSLDSQQPYILQALASGRHVIARMPITLDAADVHEMLDASQANGSRLLFSHPERFYYHNVDLRKRIKAGAIGNIGVVNVKRYCPFPTSTSAALQHEADTDGVRWTGGMNGEILEGVKGGALFRLALHDIDLLRWTVGEVANVYAMRTTTEYLDYVLVTLKFNTGAIANIEAYWGYPGGYASAIEFAGSKGVIRYDSRKTNGLSIQKAADRRSEQPMKAEFSPSFRQPERDELVHLMSCIRDGGKPFMTAEDACETLKVVRAAEQSLRTGQPVELASASTDSFVNEEVRGGGDYA